VFDVTLFMGFPVDIAYDKALKNIDSQLVELFLHSPTNHGYLTQVCHNEIRYVGKFCGSISTLVDLDLLQENIYSILKKLTPNYHCDDIPLVLFAIPSPQ
jgi:hypothetical protein